MGMKQNNSLNTKLTVMQKIQGISFALMTGYLIIKGFWLYLDYDGQKRKSEILSNIGYSRGVITDIRSFKGKGVSIEYIINGKKYELYDGVTTAFYKCHQVGDSIDIIYSKRKPSIAMLKTDL